MRLSSLVDGCRLNSSEREGVKAAEEIVTSSKYSTSRWSGWFIVPSGNGAIGLFEIMPKIEEIPKFSFFHLILYII